MKIHDYGVGLWIDRGNWSLGPRLSGRKEQDISHLLKSRIDDLPKYLNLTIKIHGTPRGMMQVGSLRGESCIFGKLDDEKQVMYSSQEWMSQSAKSFIRMIIKKSNMPDRLRLLKIMG